MYQSLYIFLLFICFQSCSLWFCHVNYHQALYIEQNQIIVICVFLQDHSKNQPYNNDINYSILISRSPSIGKTAIMGDYANLGAIL